MCITKTSQVLFVAWVMNRKQPKGRYREEDFRKRCTCTKAWSNENNIMYLLDLKCQCQFKSQWRIRTLHYPKGKEKSGRYHGHNCISERCGCLCASGCWGLYKDSDSGNGKMGKLESYVGGRLNRTWWLFRCVGQGEGERYPEWLADIAG